MIKKLDSIEEFMDPKEKKISKKDIKENKITFFTPNIAVLGIGGSGNNAVNNLINMKLDNIKFIIANTDVKSLNNSQCPNKIRLGLELTKGLGAGSNPEIGFRAAESSREEITKALEGIDLLFLIAGMGGGTGTGATSVIADIAKNLNILTLGFVTKPFNFEGEQRMFIAEKGLAELEKYIDSIIIMSNQNLFKVIKEDTSMLEAFRVTDKIIFSGIKAISDLITANGMVNLDFNDIKFIIKGGGRAIVTSAEVSGSDKVNKITESILNNPLIDDDISIINAKNILISIAGGTNMTLFEVDKIINSLRSKANKSNYINFGAIFDKEMSEKVRVSVIATSIYDSELTESTKEENISNNSSDIIDHKANINNSMMNDILKEEFVKKEKTIYQHEELDSQNMIERPNVKIDQNPFETNTISEYSGNIDNEIYSRSANISDKKMENKEEDTKAQDISKKNSLLNIMEKVEQEENLRFNYKHKEEKNYNSDDHLSKHPEKNNNLKSFFDIPPFLKNKSK